MDTLLNTKRAALQLLLSPRTLERFRVSGNGPVYLKLGKLVRYRQSDIEKYLNAQIRGSTSHASSTAPERASKLECDAKPVKAHPNYANCNSMSRSLLSNSETVSKSRGD